jgi:ornithine--oxo-acid transaminase
MPTKSEEIIELEKRYGSFNYAPLPLVFAKGKGVHLWDAEGNKYLDFVCGYSSVGQGHCHPKIVKAIQEQAETLTLISRALYSDQFAPFAEKITKLLGYERVLPMNTGAEAFDTAVKIVRKWGYQEKKIPAGQAKIVVAKENFHGRTLAAMSAASNEKHHDLFGPPMPGFVRIPFDDLTALEDVLKDSTVAAFIVEPIQAEAGVFVPADDYLAKAFSLCRKHNVLFVADEVQTGLCRTGRWLCSQHAGIRPDLVMLGKALSGGTIPVSAVLADEKILAMLQPGDHGSTFGGNPLSCHVALAALTVLEEEKLAENAEKMGQLFRSVIRDWGLKKILEVRGQGLLNAVVFDFGGDAKTDVDFSMALRANGLIAKSTRTHVFRFAPPLVIQEKEMLEGLSILQKTLEHFPS